LKVLCLAILIIISYNQSGFGQQIDQANPQQSGLSENPQYISKITFHGNKAINDKKLSEILNIQPKQKFDPKIIESSILYLLNSYKIIGYMFAKVTWEYASGEENSVVITMNIQEGEQIKMGEVAVVSLGAKISISPLIRKLDIRKSRYFDESILEKDTEKILGLYSDSGYPMATISPAVGIVNGKLNLNLHIDSGPLVKIKEIRIDGLKKTKEKIILRELPIHSGDIFDQNKVDETERLLNNIGYFQNVSPISFSKADDENLILTASVVEGLTGRINGLLGYNPSESDDGGKFVGTVDASEMNLLGTGRQISISGRRGFVNSYQIMYLEPWIFNAPIDFGTHFRTMDRSDSLIKQELSEREAGLSGIFRIGSLDKVSISGMYKKISSSAFLEDSSANSPDEELANGRKYSLALALLLDKRDYSSNPTKGWYTHTGIEVSRGDFKLFRYWAELNQYYRTLGQQVLALRLRAGQVLGDNIPPTELLYLGGTNTLRGYNEDQFRGDEIYFANFEYRFLVGRNSHFFMFLDSGKVAGNVKVGYGIGMRLESLNGTVSMDYGLAKGDSILKGKIHVSLGAVF
jgi:outer membrane protein insertion porin family